MPIADILLRVVPSTAHELERLAIAVDLAQRLQARLDGVFVIEDARDKANWAKALFERAVSRSPLETTWRVVEGHTNAALAFQARRSDLTILPAGPARGGDPCAAEPIAIESGRPVMILPAPVAALSIGHTVLVGWNDSAEASRALHEAMPILLDADKVFVLTVVAEGALEPMADRQLLQHLRQHGVPADLIREHGDAADQIAAKARALDVDMVVIGLSGEADDFPLSLGEVSRRFLRTATLPIFLSN